MAQLPPKIPNSTTDLSNFSLPRAPPASIGTSSMPDQSSWVDDFFDFSSGRREAQRNSNTESDTFLDPRSSLSVDDFDGLDDEQLMSMFSDDDVPTVPSTLSNPSTPPTSDNNSSSIDERLQPIPIATPINNTIKAPQEAQSVCHEDNMLPPLPPSTDPIADPKRVKRILANRQSAQRSRVRKLQYISELERSVTCLQTEVSALSPRVAYFDHQRSVLALGNSALKQRIAALAQDKIFKDAHQEALRKEIERLRQVYQHQQNFQNVEYAANGVATTPANMSMPTHDPNTYANNELPS